MELETTRKKSREIAYVANLVDNHGKHHNLTSLRCYGSQVGIPHSRIVIERKLTVSSTGSRVVGECLQLSRVHEDLTSRIGRSRRWRHQLNDVRRKFVIPVVEHLLYFHLQSVSVKWQHEKSIDLIVCSEKKMIAKRT